MHEKEWQEKFNAIARAYEEGEVVSAQALFNQLPSEASKKAYYAYAKGLAQTKPDIFNKGLQADVEQSQLKPDIQTILKKLKSQKKLL